MRIAHFEFVGEGEDGEKSIYNLNI